jgi:LysM repeat protein
MNNPNPLVPQGSLLEQQAKRKPHLRIVFFIVALHVVFFVGVLMQGCKREDQSARLSPLLPTNDFTLPPLDTNLYASPPPLDMSAGGSPTPYAAQPPALGANANLYSTPSTALPATTPLPSAGTPAVGEPLPFAAVGAVQYEIKRNDTFAGVAKKFGVTVSAITAANPGVNPNRLLVGQKIQVPAPSAPPHGTGSLGLPASANDPSTITYTVKPRDTLTKIAAAHGTSIKALRSANNLKTDQINVGQKLKIPAAKAPAMSMEPVSSAAPSGTNTPR